MDKRDLLLEVGVEEIPARFLPPALEQLKSLAAQGLATAGLPYDELHVYATPRRLALLVAGLADRQADSITEAKGPSVAAAYDDQGNPSRALLGFCRGQNVAEKDLRQKEVSGNLYLFAVKQVKGRTAAEILPQLLVDIILKIHFPKPMRWGYEEIRFARPIHWLVALWGMDILPLSLAGIKAGRISRGHRSLGSQQLMISEPCLYLQLLRENYVLADQSERRDIIWRQIRQLAENMGFVVKEDEELLTEVVFLLEYPTALIGSFDEKYLSLPAELIITPMREHQRYFPVYKEGALINKFIAVRNGSSDYLNIVREGNEKVIRPRLADAAFFWQEDLRQPLERLSGRLNEIVFHEKLGDMGQKVQRLEELSAYIGGLLNYSGSELQQLKRAAYLGKADLLSHAVYEFPELQGIMGEYYAQAAGEDEAVALAIREHYLPRFAGDQVPHSRVGVALALADKLDTLCGFFVAGMIPSGSQDPYALRRAAAGCVQIMARHGLFLSGRQLVGKAIELLKPHITEVADLNRLERIEQLISFLRQRVDAALGEEGLPYDIIQAMGNQQGGNIWEIILKARALHEYRNKPGFTLLLSGFTRAANLLRSAAQKGEAQEETSLTALSEELLRDSAEKRLYDHIKKIYTCYNEDLQSHRYQAALERLAGLSGDIDAFFDAVMVMDENREIRKNRLALLRQIVGLAAQMGDLAKLEVRS